MWRRGAVLAVLCVAAACARSTMDPPPAAINVTGSWTGSWTTSDQRLTGDMRLELKQDDAVVTGVLLMTGMVPGQPGGYIQGTVKEDELSFSRGRMTAVLKVRGNTMRGPMSGLAAPAVVDLYRVDR